jgi:hypothetical protein
MFAQRRSSRGLFVRLAILCCLLMLTFNLRAAGVAHDDAGASDLIILRSITPADGSDTEMLPLDLKTLADEPASATFAIDPEIMPWSVVFSRDGQTVAGMTGGDTLEIIVKRRLDGPILSRIPTEGAMWLYSLNADGSKLLVVVNSDGLSPSWKTFDTSSGAMTAEFKPGFGDLGFLNQQVVDPVSWKLYRLYPDGVEAINYQFPKGPANLVVTDLNTNAEVGRVRLPDVLIGTTVEDPGSNNAVMNNTLPGIALSPDGSEIAIVNATEDEISLVNTKTLTVIETVTMHEPTGLVEHLFGLLPLAPQTAEAKASEGEGRIALYAADGDHLYVSGFFAEFSRDVQSYSGDGLSLVNLSDGEIESHLLDGVTVQELVQDSGGDLYATGVEYRPDNKGYPYTFVAARLDEGASSVLAERRIEQNAVLILEPLAAS